MNKFPLIFFLLTIFSLGIQNTVGGNPPQSTLKLSHKLHVVDQEIECKTCHQQVAESKLGTDDLLPTMEVCSGCHDVEDNENCGMCHTDTRNINRLPRIQDYNKKFSHSFHLAKDLQCKTCHQNVVNKTKVLPVILPKMQACLDCHSNRQVSVSCKTCHLPGEKLRPVSHGQDFIHNHGLIAALDGKDPINAQNCTNCHKENYCQNCHEGDNIDYRIHPQNFSYTHALSSMLKERECATCHQDRSFCANCHLENHVLPHNHTAGWTNTIPDDGGRHRLEAERDIEYCMTCHEQNADEICQKCHGEHNNE